MPYGYSFFDSFWRREEKIKILKNISYREALIYNFFHNLIFISLGATALVIASYLVIYGEIRNDVYILLLTTLFSSFVTQSFVRKSLYIKYGYYKTLFSLLIGIFGTIFLLSSFIWLMVRVSIKISIPLMQLFKSFFIEYIGLLIIGLFFFKKSFRSKHSPLHLNNAK